MRVSESAVLNYVRGGLTIGAKGSGRYTAYWTPATVTGLKWARCIAYERGQNAGRTGPVYWLMLRMKRSNM